MIGRTLTSTLLTLLVVPTIHEVLAGMREGVRTRFGRRAAPRTREFPAADGAVPVACG